MTTRPAGGLLIWLGSDRAQKRRRLDALRATHRIDMLDVHTCEAGPLTPAQLLSLLRQQPAASPARLVVVDDAQRLKAACVQALLEHGAPRNRGAISGTESRECSAFHGAAAWATTWLVLWVDGALEARHPLQALMPQAAVERGEAADQEPRGAGRAAGGFAVVDAIAQRHTAAALRALHEQLAQGKDPLELIGLVAWQVQRWLTVKELLAAGASGERVSAVAGLQSWQLDRVQEQVRGRSVEELRGQLEACWQVDAEAKRGRTLPRPALEQLVISVCQSIPAGTVGHLRR